MQSAVGLFFFITLCSAFYTDVHHRYKRQGGCRTPDNKQGNCINIKQCDRLYELVLTVGQTDNNVREFLSKSQCGYDGRHPKVCCTESDFRTNLLPTECGKANGTTNKIVNGRPAQLRAWPWMAALGWRNQGKYEFRCGGVLINKWYVLTAAHCFLKARPAIVRLGDLDLLNETDGANHIDVPIGHIIPHKNYNAVKQTNDLAIIKLRTPVNYNADIQPVCLPLSENMRNKNIVGSEPFVIGWGVNKYEGKPYSHLQEAQIPVKSIAECKNIFKNKGIFQQLTIDERLICAGGGPKDSCQGDSGGPLLYPGPGGAFYVIGIVSYGFRCGVPGVPGMYTKVASFLNWINDNI